MRLLTSDQQTDEDNARALRRGEREKQRAEEPWEWEPGWTFDPATGRPMPPKRT